MYNERNKRVFKERYMKYYLIGENLIHSFSKDIHSRLGLDYSLLNLSEGDIQSFLEKKEFAGLNVTIPYKTTVMKYLNEIDEGAKLIGAVNTIKNKDGKLIGYNTDYLGFEYMVNRIGYSVKRKKVIVLGSGGASKAVVYALKEMGVKDITIISRNGKYNYNNVYLIKDVNVIVNTTPVGMYPNVDGSLLDISNFPKLECVLDCIYNPLMTPILLEAKKLGLKYSDGLSMLVAQAIYAEKIWFDKERIDIEDSLKHVFFKKANIVLSGMPSSGKSTIGKMLAKRLNRKWIDIDEAIKERTSYSPSEIITGSGEKIFRDIESRVIDMVSKESSLVISLGGGSILRNENIDMIKRNGILIYINRDLDKLICDDRPLSMRDGVEKLYKERKDIYERTCDFMVYNNGNLEEVLSEIERKLNEYTCY